MIIPEKITTMMNTIINSGHTCYVVGGAVRDYLLGITPDDYDLFTDASGEELLELFPEAKVIGGVERQAKILTIVNHGVEISQYRNSGDRLTTGNSLLAHVNTCDFTINAIAANVDGSIIDLVNGLSDLNNRLLRFVGNPEDRIKEDPLRIIRGIRFIIKYDLKEVNQIGDSSLLLIEKLDVLNTVSVERVREEYLKILSYNNYNDFYFTSLTESIIPEIINCYNIPGGEHHNETVYNHLYLSFQYACKVTFNPLLRLAALLHDVGKGKTYTNVGGEIHFYDHEDESVKITREFMKKYKFSNNDINYVCALIANHMFGYMVACPSKKSYLKLFARLNQEKIPVEDFVTLLYADFQGNKAKKRMGFTEFLNNSRGKVLNKYYELKYLQEPFNIRDLVINGDDLMSRYNLKPGPQIGILLKKVLDKIVDGDLKNNKSDIYGFIEEYNKKDGF